MSKKSLNNDYASRRFSLRVMLMILVAWLVSFLCATGTAITVWVGITPNYGVELGLLAAATSALATGILTFLGTLGVLNRLTSQ